MYSNLQLAKKYLQYYFRASNASGHGMHSPFVYQFIREVLNNDAAHAAPKEIEELRKRLLRDKRPVPVKDLGAGSRSGSSETKGLDRIAASALKSKKLAQLLYRLAIKYQPRTIIELGTSLGLTTAYFSRAAPSASITTIEGNPAIAAVAEENFRSLGCENIRVLTGNFDQVLPALLKDISLVDLAYIDGNHRYEPTLDYFHQFLTVSHPATILVFDDIHWSEEMERAWKEICNHASVAYTIDVFFLGFVFFRKEFKVKQDFIIKT